MTTSILRHSTCTPAPTHLFAVELESESGYRYWTKVSESNMDAFLTNATALGYGLSDVDCSTLCSHPEHADDEIIVKARAAYRAEKKAARQAARHCRVHAIRRCTICN